MPTYDYECAACGHAFEKFQSITAPAVRKCPACGKPKARRLIGTGAGVIFKGSGFYCTDYRDKSYKQAAQKDKPTGDSSSKGSSAEKPPASAGKSSSKAPPAPKSPGSGPTR